MFLFLSGDSAFFVSPLDALFAAANLFRFTLHRHSSRMEGFGSLSPCASSIDHVVHTASASRLKRWPFLQVSNRNDNILTLAEDSTLNTHLTFKVAGQWLKVVSSYFCVLFLHHAYASVHCLHLECAELWDGALSHHVIFARK